MTQPGTSNSTTARAAGALHACRYQNPSYNRCSKRMQYLQNCFHFCYLPPYIRFTISSLLHIVQVTQPQLPQAPTAVHAVHAHPTQQPRQQQQPTSQLLPISAVFPNANANTNTLPSSSFSSSFMWQQSPPPLVPFFVPAMPPSIHNNVHLWPQAPTAPSPTPIPPPATNASQT